MNNTDNLINVNYNYLEKTYRLQFSVDFRKFVKFYGSDDPISSNNADRQDKDRMKVKNSLN